jgi:hypothetical protein
MNMHTFMTSQRFRDVDNMSFLARTCDKPFLENDHESEIHCRDGLVSSFFSFIIGSKERSFLGWLSLGSSS